MSKTEKTWCDGSHTLTITVWCDRSTSIEYDFPAKRQMCENCEGYGKVLNPSIAEHAYSPEEFEEEFSPEEREHYFSPTGGMFGVKCPECKGEKIVLGFDEESFSEEDNKNYQLYLKDLERQEMLERMYASERAMGA